MVASQKKSLRKLITYSNLRIMFCCLKLPDYHAIHGIFNIVADGFVKYDDVSRLEAVKWTIWTISHSVYEHQTKCQTGISEQLCS